MFEVNNKNSDVSDVVLVFLQLTMLKCQLTMLLMLQLKLQTKEKKDDTILSKNTEEKQKSVTIIVSVDGKGTFFSSKVEIRWGII